MGSEHVRRSIIHFGHRAGGLTDKLMSTRSVPRAWLAEADKLLAAARRSSLKVKLLAVAAQANQS
eukprot:scaffold297747_cov15-Tisochrysis_lutea.AAC.1